MRLLLSLALLLMATAALGQSPDTILATVGDAPISVRVVDRELTRSSKKLPMVAAELAAARATALEACIQRALVLQELIAQKKAASSAEVEVAVTRLKKELAARDTTWEKHLAKQGLSDAEMKAELRWGLSWDAYLKEQLSDPNLERYFQRHAREFDGTTLRVAHILWKTSPSDDPAALDKLKMQVEAVRKEIAAGQLKFAEAAAKYSQAPTAKSGGDIGFIERRQPMPESFSKAAYALDVGAVSPPTQTAFGLHLITCLEIKPGDRKWTEAREELRTAVTRYLFDWLAEKGRERVKVERKA
jgi:parvulin-like peptidyl-prolyl isomerase